VGSLTFQNQETPTSPTNDMFFPFIFLVSQGKQLERRFWKQLKRRRNGANAIISSPPQVAA